MLGVTGRAVEAFAQHFALICDTSGGFGSHQRPGQDQAHAAKRLGFSIPPFLSGTVVVMLERMWEERVVLKNFFISLIRFMLY